MLTEPMAVFVKVPVKLSFEQPVSVIKIGRAHV